MSRTTKIGEKIFEDEKVKKRDNSIDRFIGCKIREKRVALGMTQSTLASHLGVTFQQVQKYEKGVNRISSSMLYTIASIFRVDMKWFMDGFYEKTANFESMGILCEENQVTYDTGTNNVETQKNKEIQPLLKAYYAIEDPQVRKKVLGIVKAFAPTQRSKKSLQIKKKYGGTIKL